MAEESQSQTIRAISWREVFPFTHIFRAFRVAIQPSKLTLALAALLIMYVGGRILDALWLDKYRAVQGEIVAYQEGKPLDEYRQRVREHVARRYEPLLEKLSVKPGEVYRKLAEDREFRRDAALKGLYTKHVRYRIRCERDEAVRLANEDYARSDKGEQAREARDRRIKEAYEKYREELEVIDNARGRGLFISFVNYQSSQMNAVVSAVVRGDWLGPGGVVESVQRFFTVAPGWALWHHPLYFVLFSALFIVVWAIFGGAIARMVAVQMADEDGKLTISVRQGLSFAASKFLSFLSAPLIPLLIIAVVGLFTAVVAWVLFVLRLDVLVGMLFFLPLAAAAVMTLVLLGTAGGFSLMYPAIAVEGSDSFDAISRAFSYVFMRPWRLLWYATVGVAYGSVTYLFCRIVVWLILLLTHVFVGLLVFRTTDAGTNLWTALFPAPAISGLRYQIDTATLGGYGQFTAWFIALWTYLLLGLLGAFAVSMYFSVSTVIYLLLRRDQDSTDMHEVYQEQPEEEVTETSAPLPQPAPAGGQEAQAGTAQPTAPSDTQTPAPPAQAAPQPVPAQTAPAQPTSSTTAGGPGSPEAPPAQQQPPQPPAPGAPSGTA